MNFGGVRKKVNLNLDLIFQDYFYLLHYLSYLVQKEITNKQTLELYVLVNNAFISSFDKSFNESFWFIFLQCLIFLRSQYSVLHNQQKAILVIIQ